MRLFIALVLIISLFFHTTGAIAAQETRDTAVIGMHVLFPGEMKAAKQALKIDDYDDRWHYVTVPFTLDDVEKKAEWQKYFNQAREQKIIPLVRLATRMEGSGWTVPDQKDIVDQLEVLSELRWPTSERHVIIFNEVNHAKEWGGRLEPEEYARLFRFASKWAKTEEKNFVVLPAAMDLAAPNGRETMEAFNYLERMYAFDNEIFSYADAWNSHSYPNPAFSAPPNRLGKNSLLGFIHELNYLRSRTGMEYQVFITETGWEESARLKPLLPGYYDYAVRNIWSHPQVVAVTPFIFQGSPGPFSGFSFLNEDGQPTAQHRALRTAIEKQYLQERSL
jgi:hypothetical protein